MTRRNIFLPLMALALAAPGCASTLAEDIYAWNGAPLKKICRNLIADVKSLKKQDPATSSPAEAASAVPPAHSTVATISPESSGGLWAELSVDPHTLIARAHIRNDGPGECLVSGLSGSDKPTALLLTRAGAAAIEPLPPVVLWRGMRSETRLISGESRYAVFDLKNTFGALGAGTYRLRLRGIPCEAAEFTVQAP